MLMEVNQFVSLGDNCHTAMMLKVNNYKTCSFAFDWTFCNINVFKHCLETNFYILLDRTQYENTPNNPLASSHKIYGQYFFNHRNMLVDENYEYLNRCVVRLTTLMHNSMTKVFVFSCRTSPYTDYLETIKQVNSFLHNICGGEYELLILSAEMNTGTPPRINSDKHIERCIRVVEYNCCGGANGMLFVEEIDNTFYNNILKSLYKINIQSF